LLFFCHHSTFVYEVKLNQSKNGLLIVEYWLLSFRRLCGFGFWEDGQMAIAGTFSHVLEFFQTKWHMYLD